jgi:uncharacterized cupin superfamily protein
MEGPRIAYAGQQLHVLAGAQRGEPWAIAEIVVPANFPGPVPHVHTTFDEGIYLIERVLQVVGGDAEPSPSPAGSFFTAMRGIRHSFRNPSDRPARVLGV